MAFLANNGSPWRTTVPPGEQRFALANRIHFAGTYLRDIPGGETRRAVPIRLHLFWRCCGNVTLPAARRDSLGRSERHRSCDLVNLREFAGGSRDEPTLPGAELLVRCFDARRPCK